MQLVRKIYLLFSGEKCYYRNMSEQNIEKNNYIKESSGPKKRRNCLLPCFSDQKRQAYQSWQFPRCLTGPSGLRTGASPAVRSFPDTAVLREGVPFVLRKMGQSDQSAGQRTIHRQSDLSGTAALLLLFVPPPCLKIRHGRPVLLFFP